jgi:hypothetical protein
MASRARKRKSSPKARKRKSAVGTRKRKSTAKTAKRKSAVGARKRRRTAKTAKRSSTAKTAKRKSAAKRARRALAAAADPVVQRLKDLIAAGKLIFDADRHRKSLLGLNAGRNATKKLQSLVVRLSELAGQQLRISSVVRPTGGSHHVTGRAVDIGNEEVAPALLPRVATDAQVAALAIDEIIFDARLAGETDRNKWNYDRGRKHDYGTSTLNQHGNHIHFAVKA